ncbi:hypothetical protein Tco_0021249, partial [Tanacetum coccineum]
AGVDCNLFNIYDLGMRKSIEACCTPGEMKQTSFERSLSSWEGCALHHWVLDDLSSIPELAL